MHLTVNESFIFVMLAVFTLPFLLWKVTGKRSYAPLVVIQILAGVLLGPGIAGQAFPDTHAAILSPPVITALNGVALWAVVLFVFVAGLELDLRSAWANRRETTIVASSALFFPMIAGSAAAALLLLTPGWIGPNATPLQAILGIGMACAVTALPILIVFMESAGFLRHPLGQRVLRYASLDDIAIWAVLALILLDWDRVLRQVAFLALFTLATLLMRRLIPRLQDTTDRWYAGLAWLLACALASDWAGLHYMVGAFLAGAVLDARWFDQDRLDRFRDTVLMALMPVFFLATGLRTNWETGGLAVLGAAALLLAAAIGGKLAGVHLAGRILGWPRGEATVVGWLLQTKALIMIIFANVLLDRAIITAETFTALLLMALVSTMLTLPMVLPRLARLGVSPARR